MGGQTHKHGDSEDHIEDYQDELPDNQVVRRFLSGHERHRHPEKRRRRRSDEDADAEKG